MEFVALAEIKSELRDRGILDEPGSSGGSLLTIDPARAPTLLQLGSCNGSGRQAGTVIVDAPDDQLAAVLEVVLHKLHLAPLYLVPATRWRSIFDVVAFGLAANQQWQDIEAQASVEQNTRDPLVCEARDLHTLRELVRVLLADGDRDEAGESQSLAIVATGQPLVAHITPGRPIHVMVGNAKVAEHARDAAAHFLGRT